MNAQINLHKIEKSFVFNNYNKSRSRGAWNNLLTIKKQYSDLILSSNLKNTILVLTEENAENQAIELYEELYPFNFEKLVF
jgi:uridine kinase